MICSGLLAREADEVAADFERAGLVVHQRRASGDWAALYMREAGR
jgi:ribosomal protein L11 methylase PrmA